MQTRLDPFALLERADKWYLGGGRATMFAPAFPKYLDTPGYWDESYYADIRLDRLYCVLLLDESARPLTLRRAVRRWTPDRLNTLYTVDGHPTLRVQEERVITQDDTLACRLTLSNSGARTLSLNLILWSLQPVQSAHDSEIGLTVDGVEHQPDAIGFTCRVRRESAGAEAADVYGWGRRTRARAEDVLSTLPDRETPARSEGRGGEQATPTGGETPRNPADAGSQASSDRLCVALGANRMPDSWTVNLAETTDLAPLWQISVLPEKFVDGRLPCEMHADSGWNPAGLLHIALHYRVEAPPGGADSVTFGAAVSPDQDTALARLRADMASDVVLQSRNAWRAYFDAVPYFECDDPYLEHAYWYRWYGLRLLTVNVADGHLPYPCVFEGIGAFRSHISYSAQCHVRETAWMRDSGLAMGSLENFLANQVRSEEDLEDGFLPGHLYLWRQDRGFYHADWGGMARRIYDLTGDLDFVRRVYPALVRYAEYCDRTRDRERLALCDVLDQGETGQEYMSRYLFADPDADAWGRIQIKGVDASCYLYQLQRALAYLARALGEPDDADWWDEKADATRAAIRELMWDPDAQLFKDIDPHTLKRSPYLAAVGFYPFLSDIAEYLHLPALRWHLRDPATFGTPYPVPACSVNDPWFSADASWKDRRTNCPWNGRVWPLATSHVADALAHAARTFSPELRPAAADLIRRFIGMLFHDGDPSRPNCYEHYNPYTGMPSLYRGVDDYQHSWIVDLIVRHVVGVQPTPGERGSLVVDPLPFDLGRFCAEGIPIRGHRVDVSYDRDLGFTVSVDGREKARLPKPARVEVAI